MKNKIYILIESYGTMIFLRKYSSNKKDIIEYARNNTELTNFEFEEFELNESIETERYSVYIEEVESL